MFKAHYPRSGKRATYAWSAVEEGGPTCFANCYDIAICRPKLACSCSARTFLSPSCASFISSSSVRADDETAIAFGPLLGEGDGPLLDDATVCDGAFDGGRSCHPLQFILSRGGSAAWRLSWKLI